jgi:hypothetical protein
MAIDDIEAGGFIVSGCLSRRAATEYQCRSCGTLRSFDLVIETRNQKIAASLRSTTRAIDMQ